MNITVMHIALMQIYYIYSSNDRQNYFFCAFSCEPDQLKPVVL
jgi:hypothetical protein